MRRMLLPVLASALVVALDQLAKAAALAWLSEPLSWGPLTLRLVRNDGIAFGALAGYAGVALVAALSLALVLFVALRGEPRHWPLYGLVLGGGLSNLLDRLLRGHVVDFVDLPRWPVFNLADAAISVGVLLLVLSLMRERGRDDEDSTLPSRSDD